MRIVVVDKNQPLPELLARAAAPTDRSAAVLQLRALNPQLDFAHLAAGAVVVVPGAAAGSSPGAQPLADFAAATLAAIRDAQAAARRAAADRQADMAEVAAALALETVKAALAKDPVLQADADAAVKAAQADEKTATADQKTLATLGKSLQQEFELLAKLLG